MNNETRFLIINNESYKITDSHLRIILDSLETEKEHQRKAVAYYNNHVRLPDESIKEHLQTRMDRIREVILIFSGKA